jgi:2-phospho-L-lactate guanylyltransferase
VNPHILIPCKSLVQAKSRLAPLLSESERHKLSLFLFEKTMELAAMLAPKAQCHVVTSDAVAKERSRIFGFDCIEDAGMGLNPALDHARQSIIGADPQAALLVLPIDLPYATEFAIRELVTATADIAISPDRQLTGTNVLYLAPRTTDFPFQFGEGSFNAHCDTAHRLNKKLAIQVSNALSFDLDTPENYAEMQSRSGS